MTEGWRDGLRVRVYVGETDRVGRRALHEEIVVRARDRGLHGATVFRGLEGFGRHARIHTARVLAISDDLPIVVELIDATEVVEAFLREIEEIVGEGLVTVEPVRWLVVPRSGAGPADR